MAGAEVDIHKGKGFKEDVLNCSLSKYLSEPVEGWSPSEQSIGTFFRKQDASEYENDFTVYLNFEHGYSKHWSNSKEPEGEQISLPITLFAPKEEETILRSKYLFQEDEEIDVEGDFEGPDSPSLVYHDKAYKLMEECERHCLFADPNDIKKEEPTKVEEGEETTEEKNINRLGWSRQQERIYDKVVQILDSERLVRLSLSKVKNEPVKRRALLDRSAGKLSQVLSSIRYDSDLCKWLHTELVSTLDSPYLVAYLDILQTLHFSSPALIDSLCSNGAKAKGVKTKDTGGYLSSLGLSLLLQRPWDPALPTLHLNRASKLDSSVSPLVIVVPCTPKANPVQARRHRHFISMLSSVTSVHLPDVQYLPDRGLECWLEEVVSSVRTKVQECAKKNRPIVLLGWHSAALIACQLSVVDPLVSAVVCLSLPFSSVEDFHLTHDVVEELSPEGVPDGGDEAVTVLDNLMGVTCPLLMVQGDKCVGYQIEDVKGMRSKLRCKSHLVVVCGANDKLKLNAMQRYRENLTPSVVDRCIVEELSIFLSSLMPAPPSPPPPSTPLTEVEKAEEEVVSLTLNKEEYAALTGVDDSCGSLTPSQGVTISTPAGQGLSPSKGPPPSGVNPSAQSSPQLLSTPSSTLYGLQSPATPLPSTPSGLLTPTRGGKRGRRPGRSKKGRTLPDEQLIALGSGKGVAHKQTSRRPVNSVGASGRGTIRAGYSYSRSQKTTPKQVSIKEQMAQAAASEAQLMAAIASITPKSPPKSPHNDFTDVQPPPSVVYGSSKSGNTSRVEQMNIETSVIPAQTLDNYLLYSSMGVGKEAKTSGTVQKSPLVFRTSNSASTSRIILPNTFSSPSSNQTFIATSNVSANKLIRPAVSSQQQRISVTPSSSGSLRALTSIGGRGRNIFSVTQSPQNSFLLPDGRVGTKSPNIGKRVNVSNLRPIGPLVDGAGFVLKGGLNLVPSNTSIRGRATGIASLTSVPKGSTITSPRGNTLIRGSTPVRPIAPGTKKQSFILPASGNFNLKPNNTITVRSNIGIVASSVQSPITVDASTSTSPGRNPNSNGANLTLPKGTPKAVTQTLMKQKTFSTLGKSTLSVSMPQFTNSKTQNTTKLSLANVSGQKRPIPSILKTVGDTGLSVEGRASPVATQLELSSGMSTLELLATASQMQEKIKTPEANDASDELVFKGLVEDVLEETVEKDSTNLVAEINPVEDKISHPHSDFKATEKVFHKSIIENKPEKLPMKLDTSGKIVLPKSTFPQIKIVSANSPAKFIQTSASGKSNKITVSIPTTLTGKISRTGIMSSASILTVKASEAFLSKKLVPLSTGTKLPSIYTKPPVSVISVSSASTNVTATTPNILKVKSTAVKKDLSKLSMSNTTENNKNSNRVIVAQAQSIISHSEKTETIKKPPQKITVQKNLMMTKMMKPVMLQSEKPTRVTVADAIGGFSSDKIKISAKETTKPVEQTSKIYPCLPVNNPKKPQIVSLSSISKSMTSSQGTVHRTPEMTVNRIKASKRSIIDVEVLDTVDNKTKSPRLSEEGIIDKLPTASSSKTSSFSEPKLTTLRKPTERIPQQESPSVMQEMEDQETDEELFVRPSLPAKLNRPTETGKALSLSQSGGKISKVKKRASARLSLTPYEEAKHLRSGRKRSSL